MSTENIKPLSEVEIIKEKSNYLRGTIVQSLENELTGNLFPDDQQLIKLHGSYVQSDRDTESERKKQKLEPAYSFMIRVRLPAGIVSKQQWIAMDALTDQYGIGTLKLTTRQAFELHGVLKRNLKTSIQAIHDTLLDTLAACGDVNRNVMAGALPNLSAAHAEIQKTALDIHTHLSPKTTAYHEIWLEKKLISGGEKEDFEPIYGKTYLPRKFKIGIAIPPVNDTDVFSQDIGLIAIIDNNTLCGYNVSVGGGMGMTFSMPETYPRLGTVIGFINKEKIVDVVEKIVLIQRDYGDRTNRKTARLKYTIDRMGVDAFKAELHKRLSYELEVEKHYKFETSGDVFGWKQSQDGTWSNTLFVEGGRLKDTESAKQKTAIRILAEKFDFRFILTGNQNLVIDAVKTHEKLLVDEILMQYGFPLVDQISGLRKNSIACVALSLCPMAFSEAERYLPSLLDKIEMILKKYKLENDSISIRMTGCPNGCGRPFLAEIGLVGKAPGRYNVYLGAKHNGMRLNTIFREMLNEEEILKALEPIFGKYANERLEKETFGDFVIRKNIVPEMLEHKNFQNINSDKTIRNSSFEI